MWKLRLRGWGRVLRWGGTREATQRPLLSFLIQYRAGETHHGLIGDSLLPPKPAFAALSRFFGARRLSGHHAMSLSLCYSLMSCWCFLCSTSSCQTHREISNSEVFILSSVWFPRKCRKGEELEVCILVFFFSIIILACED